MGPKRDFNNSYKTINIRRFKLLFLEKKNEKRNSDINRECWSEFILYIQKNFSINFTNTLQQYPIYPVALY